MTDRDRAWVKETLDGNDQAFTHLVDAYATPVYNLAYRMLGTAEEAEDAAQETFLRAYTRLHTYDAGRKFSSWLLSIASHHCIDRLRRRRSNLVSLDELPPWNMPASDAESSVQRLIRQEREERIRRFLLQLPPDYRLALVLRYWYDLSYTEMAEMTGTTVSAVKSRLHRARLRLAALLTEADAEAERASHLPAVGEMRPARVWGDSS